MDDAAFRNLVEEYVAAIQANRQVPRTLPEAALYAPLDGLVNGFLRGEGFRSRAVQQARTEFGVPDFVIDEGGDLGYIEAKRLTANLHSLPAGDRAQQERFLCLPNVIYTNYRDFQLFEDGEPVDEVSLGGLKLFDPRHPEPRSDERLRRLHHLLRRFASHRIATPRSASDLAHALARATRVLRDATSASLRAPEGAVASLRAEWKALLFEDFTDEEFADAYAQTVSYGLLTARLDSTGRLNVQMALTQLERRHPFLAAALRLLTHPRTDDEVGWAVRVVVETLDGVSHETFRSSRHPDDPLLYFYEDFLAEYDAGLRDRRGVFYTPASVVGFQVRAVAGLLDELGFPMLLADDVVALDPAAGTGTYLLALLDETAAKLREAGNELMVPAATRRAATHLKGFEVLVGPYTVAHQRLGARLDQLGARGEAVEVYLADTLAEPNELALSQLNLFERQLGEERNRADEVKREAEVMVVLGNPPYYRAKGRHRQDWLQQKMSLFSAPVRPSARVNLKNLADPYVHFFRWALWKLFESPLPLGPRLLTFISNRSYLGGDAFEGMRLALRQRFDEIWLVDLGGDGRGGPAGDENVFDIRVGVAIVVALRRDAAGPPAGEARVRYARLTGTRADKELVLKAGLDDLVWTEVRRPAGEPFLPDLSPTWRRWVALDQLMPLRQSGVQTKRDKLAVGVTPQELAARLRALLDPDLTDSERREIFHETQARPCPTKRSLDLSRIRPFGYRPLDNRWLYDDPAFIDRPRPKLRKYWHRGQRAFVTLPKGHRPGPAVFVHTELPDLHAFKGDTGGHVFPLWLDPDHHEPNLARGFLARLRSHLRADIAADDVFAYVYGLLGAPGYQARFADELAQGFPRVPFPVDAGAFRRVAELGAKLLAVHQLPSPTGKARLTGSPGPILARPSRQGGRLQVSPAGFVEPVTEAAWRYSVSGYRVIERWLRARAGLDLARDFDLIDQLHRVVDAVEASVRLGGQLDAALARVLDGETVGTAALLAVDVRRASEELAAVPGALEDAAREAELLSPLSDEALLEAESG